VDSDYWGDYNISGLKYYILHFFTELQNVKIEISDILVKFSIYLVASQNKELINYELMDFANLLNYIYNIYRCQTDLGQF
jgi:hypothetical protein